MILISDNFKRLFGARAAKALNALAKFANNFSAGYGLSASRKGDSIVMSLDQATVRGVAQDVCKAEASTTTTQALWGSPDTSGTAWQNTDGNNFAVYLPYALADNYGGKPSKDRIWFGLFTFGPQGNLIKVERSTQSLDVIDYSGY